MRGVQALGLLLPGSQRVQVSLNVIDVEAARLADVVARVREVAAERGRRGGRAASSSASSRRAPSPRRALLGLEALPDELVLETAGSADPPTASRLADRDRRARS